MKTKNILTACFLCIASALNAQNFEWVKATGGNSAGERNNICTDDFGNIYITGIFDETQDFDPGAGTHNLTSQGGYDIYIQKLDADGNFVWAKGFGGVSDDRGQSIGIDALGNVYTLGYFSSTVDFDPGLTTNIISSVTARDLFVQKMDPDGNFLWARTFGTTESASADPMIMNTNSIAVDASGNVYSTGPFSETADFDPSAGVTNLSAAGPRDIFVQKIDADGNFHWAYALGVTYSYYSHSNVVDTAGDLYIIGNYTGTVDFDPGPGILNLTTSSPNGGGFVQKVDSDGNLLWAFALEANIGSICADPSGNIYTTGFFTGTVDFDPGTGTQLLEGFPNEPSIVWMFIQKLDSSGNFIWAKMIASDYIEVFDICTDTFGNVYTTGRFHFTTDFDPGQGEAIFTPFDTWNLSILTDAFILKMDASGEFLWVRTIIAGDFTLAIPYSICVTDLGDIYTKGHFAGPIDFDLGPGTYYLSEEYDGLDYLHKMSQGTEVNGYVFVDTNGNGIMDAGEITVPYQTISYNNENDAATTNDNGFFRAFPPVGNQEFNYQPPSYYTNTTPVSQTVDVQIGVIDTLYFGIEPISNGNDLVVDIHPYESPRPGFTRNYQLSYQNVGTTALNDVVLKFLKTEEDDLVLASGAYTVSNDTLIWNLGTVEPFSNGSFTITHTLSTSAVLGDYTYTQAWILPTSDDETPLNNVIALEEEIVAAYDPNDKSVTPETSEPTENEPLEYTIRFQNTGNFQADFVVVKDTLSNLLDLTTFQMIAASHEYEVAIENRIATWTFNEINLPDSTSDEAGSHGFIKFKVQRIDGLGVGTQIHNSVAIYFDYNEPVITNTCIYSIETCISTGTDIQSACNSYTWIDGNTYTSSNNTATYIIDNVAGCDSIVTLNLIINNVSNIGTTLSGATITANNSNATYQWLDCNNNNEPIEGATSQTFTATESGNYAVEVTENGCTNTSTCVAVTIIGLSEWSNDLQAAVYPNPSQGNVEITLGSAMQNVELMLTDIQGRVIFTRNYTSLLKTNIELPDAKGVYMLKLKAQDSTSTLRLVKE